TLLDARGVRSDGPRRRTRDHPRPADRSGGAAGGVRPPAAVRVSPAEGSYLDRTRVRGRRTEPTGRVMSQERESRREAAPRSRIQVTGASGGTTSGTIVTIPPSNAP